MSKLIIKERGWAGHFICSQYCGFRRNTLIEYGDKRIIVSTVGNYRSPIEKEKASTIGINRYYETMAFEAKWEHPYWEVDVTRQVYFESDWAIDHIEFDTDKEANDMHEAVVNELSIEIQKK